MTSYPFLKMVAVTAEYCFRFSYLLMPLPTEGQSLLANQILSRYLKWQLRYNYFRFPNTNVISISHISFYFRFRSRTVRRNLHDVILHQYAKFRPNRSTYCGNMTSYPFLNMAAATAKYYFRFRIFWCHSCRRSKSIYKPNFVHISSLAAEI